MVVTGELTGMILVVANFEDYVELWLPAQRAPGIISNEFQSQELPPLSVPPTFVEWYRAWLIRSLIDIQALKLESG